MCLFKFWYTYLNFSTENHLYIYPCLLVEPVKCWKGSVKWVLFAIWCQCLFNTKGTYWLRLWQDNNGWLLNIYSVSQLVLCAVYMPERHPISFRMGNALSPYLHENRISKSNTSIFYQYLIINHHAKLRTKMGTFTDK